MGKLYLFLDARRGAAPGRDCRSAETLALVVRPSSAHVRQAVPLRQPVHRPAPAGQSILLRMSPASFRVSVVISCTGLAVGERVSECVRGFV